MDIADNLVSAIEAGSHHKYLGGCLSGEFTCREGAEANHRAQCAWHKFGQHASTLCNPNIAIRLRLKLFDAIITPTVLFGIPILPLSAASFEKLDILQRKVLRKIVGWVRLKDESWEITMHRMKDRVQRALLEYAVISWKQRLATYSWNHILRAKTVLFE